MTTNGQNDMKSIVDKIFERRRLAEDAILDDDAGMPAGDVVASGSPSTGATDIVQQEPGTGTDEILGTCNHQKNGYMSAGCFHIPAKALKKYSREIPRKKKKGHKNPYLKGMNMINEKDIKAVRSMDKRKIAEFVECNYSLPEESKVKLVEAIAYCPKSSNYLIKARLDNGTTVIAPASFDGQKFTQQENLSIMSLNEAKSKYAKDKDSKLYVVYNRKLHEELGSSNEAAYLDEVLRALEDVPANYLRSQMHVGPYGYHIGDIGSIQLAGDEVLLVLKKAHTTLRRGPVEGGMTVEDVVSKLKDIQQKSNGKRLKIIATIPLDPISQQLRMKPRMMPITDVEIAARDGVWLRTE